MCAEGPEDEGDAPAASPGTDDPPGLPARSHAPASRSRTEGRSAEAARPADAGDDGDAYRAFQETVKGTNINPQTLLATDYLNHFNEIVMTLEMIPDMPDLLGDARGWRPKTYREHFQESGFAHRELAIEAYEHVPARFRQPFELTIGTLNSLIAMTLERAEATVAAGQFERLKSIVNDASGAIRSLLDSAGAIIHGTARTMEQSEIDALLRP
ncbi:MAG: hypothetical protein ACE5FR_12825 [Rhodospirillales bacterium]